MASSHAPRFVAAALVLAMNAVSVAALVTPSSALEHIPPTNKRTDIYIGMPFLWPEDRVSVANNQPGTWEWARLYARDNKPNKDLKIVPVTPMPAGYVIQYDAGLDDWFLWYPADKPIPKTLLRYHVIDKDGQWSRAGHTIEVTAAPEDPTPVDPDPEPQPNKGPVVDFSSATFYTGDRYEMMVTIADYDKKSRYETDDVKHAFLRAPAGFRIEHMDGINWKLIIEPTVKPGMHDIGISAEDEHGNVGEETVRKIEILPTNALEQELPGPGPGLPKVPNTKPHTGTIGR